MASPSSSSSYLNSTCGLLAFLDLNEKKTANMEDMETEWMVDVPDTPDRLAARKITGGKIQKETDPSLSSHLRNSDFMMEKSVDGMEGLGLLVNENGHNSRLVSSTNTIPGDDVKGRRNSIVLPPKQNSYASKNNLLFRRPGTEKHSSQGMKPFIVPRRMDKGISISVDTPRAPPCPERDHKHKSQMVYRQLTAWDHKSESTSKEDSARYMLDALKKTNTNFKGKEKVFDDSFQDVGLSMIHRKEVEKFNDTDNKHEKQVLASLQSVISQRATGQKRLVRNGCISPHNIATRAKNLAEQHDKSSSTVDQTDLGNIASCGQPHLIDIKDVVAEDNHSNREKGKGVILQPSISQGDDVKVIHASSSDTIKAIGVNPAGGSRLDTLECSEGQGSWRRTHNYSRKVINLSDPSGSSFKKINNVGRRPNGKIESVMERQITSGQEDRAESDCSGNTYITQRASSILPKIDQTSGPCHTDSKLNKRQKKHGSTSQNNISCRIPDVMFLDSSGESSNSRLTRLRSRRIHDNSNEIIEVDELSPEMRHPISQAADCPNDDHSDARARQVEADEMLARELQEQLYQEMHVGGVEIDEHIAMTLQQVEDGLHTSSRRNHSRGSLVAQANRRPRSQSLQSSSNRRETRARVTHSTRMAQLRNQFFGGAHRASSGRRNINFPMHMDLDMRLDILEALEAAVGDMEDVTVNNDIVHIHRDFNENDYEMLLALDENNHCHAGASTNRINSLPQSTVQTDSIEEPCAICLEIPTIGDVIRHLPCLHKFHKDCIDPWLHRRTSCPVCKSSIT